MTQDAVRPPVSDRDEQLHRYLPAEDEDGDDYAVAVQRMLHVVRVQVGMQVAWTSEFRGGEQRFRFVDAEPGAAAPSPGSSEPLAGSYCARVLDGRLPAVIADVSREPGTALLQITRDLQIGSYLGVPLRSETGEAVGMLCAVSSAAAPALGERELHAMALLAELINDLQGRAEGAADRTRTQQGLRAEIVQVIEGVGRYAVLQPVVDLRSHQPVMAEGLTRFDGADRTPAQWFDAASTAGLREELEVAAARTILELLSSDTLPCGVALTVNLGPGPILAVRLAELLVDVDLERVVLEVTEHEKVLDYDRLHRELEPYRRAGLRIAVDDAGAGFASLRHVLAIAPDIVKIDMALVRGIDADPVRQALVRALAALSDTAGSILLAEGVETQQELDMLAGLGVRLAQGYLLARPDRSPRWSGYPAPGAVPV